MDPVQKHFFYNHWIQNQNEKNEFAKNHAYLVGSIINPEMGKILYGESDPNTKKFESDDDAFEESWEMLKQEREVISGKESPVNNRKKRRVKKNKDI